MALDLNKIVGEVDSFVKGLAPYIQPMLMAAEGAATVIAPEAVAGLAIGGKIISGVMQAEPAAVSLYQQIVSGTPPTADQLKQYEDGYEASYQQLQADIKAKLASLPA